jgi:hypothetical protein
MAETLNLDEQREFIKDVINNVLRKSVMEKFGLSNRGYDYYRQKLSYMIDEHRSLAEVQIRANYNLSENKRLLARVWKNLEELIAFKKTICDRVLYNKVDLEIENLSILYSEALAYDKPIIVPPRLKELDDEQTTD